MRSELVSTLAVQRLLRRRSRRSGECQGVMLKTPDGTEYIAGAFRSAMWMEPIPGRGNGPENPALMLRVRV